MRLIPVASAAAVLAASFVALPVAALPAAQAEPVAPVVTEVPIDLGAPAARAGEDGARVGDGAVAAAAAPVVVEQDTSQSFSVIGFRWDAGTPAPTVEVKVRESGRWTDWEALETSDGGPDAGTAEAAGAGTQVTTEPLLSAEADGFQVRVTPAAGRVPAGLTAITVDPGESPADSSLQGSVPVATANAAGGAPAIISRAQWGADEGVRLSKPGCETPSYSSTIKVAVVHHTASTNDYDAAGAAALVRGIYAYHVNGNGWCDIGYNFLVDKFGRVFEGRFGGVARPVIGAHAGGFNRDTFGVSAIGDYGTAGAPDAMTDAIARVVGWKLGLHNRPPQGRQTLVSAGGGTSRYPAGQAVTLDTVIGHRDVGSTSCPGGNLYNRLGTIRSIATVVAAQTDVTIVDAAPATQQVAYAGAPARFSAYVPSAQPWEATVVEECTGRTVRRYAGYTEPGTFPGAWDLREDAGGWARGGGYVWYLRTAAGGIAAGRIQVVPPRETAPSGEADATVSRAGFVPVAPVRVHDSRTGTTQPLGPDSSRRVRVVGGGTGLPESGVAAVALNVTAVCASQPSYLSAWPTGNPEPATSSLNVGAGDTVPGMVVVPVGADGSVTIGNSAGSAHLLVDVIGYFPTSGGSTLRTTIPTRVLDGAGSPMAAGESRTVDLATQLGVPRGALTGAVVNVTVSGASGPGNVQVQPAGSASDASTANVVVGRDVSNRSMVATGDGRITVRMNAANARVFVDVVGYFTTDGGGARYTSVAPSRVLDTRDGPGRRAPLGAGERLSVGVAGVAGVPPAATAVLGTLTSDQTSTPTHLRAWATGGALPATSDLNPWPGVAAANAAVLPVGGGGSSTIYNNAGTTHVVLDVVGYFS